MELSGNTTWFCRELYETNEVISKLNVSKVIHTHYINSYDLGEQDDKSLNSMMMMIVVVVHSWNQLLSTAV
jgi:hypothetical protein